MKTKKFKLAGMLLLPLLLIGCVPSLNPLYTEDTLAFRQELTGVFAEEGSLDTWSFSVNDDKGYVLNLHQLPNNNIDDGRTGTTNYFEIHLVKLGASYYLDFYPGDNDELGIGDLLGIHLFPVHTFARIEFEPGRILISQINPDFVEEQIENNYTNLKHVKNTDGDLLLTASPSELQKFLMKFGDNEDLFFDPIVLFREES